jgi:hypothetical protein
MNTPHRNLSTVPYSCLALTHCIMLWMHYASLEFKLASDICAALPAIPYAPGKQADPLHDKAPGEGSELASGPCKCSAAALSALTKSEARASTLFSGILFKLCRIPTALSPMEDSIHQLYERVAWVQSLPSQAHDVCLLSFR